MDRETGWYFVRGTGSRKWQCAFYDAEFTVWDAPTFICNFNLLVKDGEIEVGDRITMPSDQKGH